MAAIVLPVRRHARAGALAVLVLLGGCATFQGYLDPEGPQARDNLGRVACACRVLTRIRMEQGTTQVVLQGLRRVRILRVTTSRPYLRARVECVEEPGPDSLAVGELIRIILQLLEILVRADKRYTERLTPNISTARRRSNVLGRCSLGGGLPNIGAAIDT